MYQPSANGYVVGAYAASPAHQQWHPDLERAYLDQLAGLPLVGALELPWMGGLHPHDEDWLLANLPAALDVVLTDIPNTVRLTSLRSTFGLASAEEDGRRAAVETLARLHRDVQRLNDHAGRQRVRVVELHSAPQAHLAGVDAFADSLALVAGWDWDGAELVVEHCDAAVAGQAPEKGYLRLDEEIAAIEASGADVGIFLNWGRSAIELRDPDRVHEHVLLAAGTGLLRGLMFSGASDRACAFGYPWIDAHHPLARSSSQPLGEPASLLTEERLALALDSAGPLAWAGVKVGCAVKDTPVSGRVAMIGDALEALHRSKRIGVRDASVSGAAVDR